MPATYTRFVKFHHMHNLHCVYDDFARRYILHYMGSEIASVKDVVAWNFWDELEEKEIVSTLEFIKLFG
jgi:hypothetical protein